MGLVGGGGTWEVTHRGRGEKSGGGVQIAVAVGNLIFLGRMMKMLIAMVTGLTVSSAAWGQELAQAKAEFAKQDKPLNADYGEPRKTIPFVLFARGTRDQGDWVE